jgi:hypothetical protein
MKKVAMTAMMARMRSILSVFMAPESWRLGPAVSRRARGDDGLADGRTEPR